MLHDRPVGQCRQPCGGLIAVGCECGGNRFEVGKIGSVSAGSITLKEQRRPGSRIDKLRGCIIRSGRRSERSVSQLMVPSPCEDENTLADNGIIFALNSAFDVVN